MNEVSKTDQLVWFKTLKTELTEFVNTLKAEPPADQIKINTLANNSKYIPIGWVESKLDYLFHGLWETKNFQWSVIVNEIACSITLRVFHPIAGIWIERTGTAAVQIQLRAEYEMKDGQRVKKAVDVLDVSKKIANTVQKDLPHAKAEAVKNAARSLGESFGRNLNRDLDEQEVATVDDAEILIGSIDNLKELSEYYKSLPSLMKADPRVKAALKKQETFLKQPK